MPSKYTFSEYCTDWPAKYEQAADQLREILKGDLKEVHHIGSTSVPGLAAKPIIDVLPLVHDIERIADLTPLIEEAGLASWGEYGLPGRRYFTKDDGEYRVCNVHIYQHNHPDAVRHLAFCAYLRRHSTVRREYESLKRQAYAQHPADIDAYNDAKNAWIKKMEVVAVQWYQQKEGE